MAAFIVALTLGGAVAIAYLLLAAQSFSQIRRETLLANASGRSLEEPHLDSVYANQGGKFAWKASVGVIVSVVLIYLLGVSSAFWYVFPFLSIGSATAVVIAFLVDKPS